MFQTKIDFEYVAAVKTIAHELKEANNLKRTELRLLAMMARPNCRKGAEGEFLERLTEDKK